jgi:hypothetical protein
MAGRVGTGEVAMNSATISIIIAVVGATPIVLQTLSTTSNNMGYSAATASNYLYIINNIVGILKKHGLIKT